MSAAAQANKALTTALTDRDLPHEEKTAKFLTYLDATNSEAAQFIRDNNAFYEEKIKRFIALNNVQADTIAATQKAQDELKIENGKLREANTQLVIDASRKEITDKNEAKHGKVSISVVGDTEEEITDLKAAVVKRQRYIDKHKWIIDGFYWIIGGFVIYVIITLIKIFK